MENGENKNLLGRREFFNFYSKHDSNECNRGMRKIIKCLLFIVITISGLKVSAQDIIVNKDGQIIKSKVVEISETSVLYKDFTNPEGPTYSIKIKNILSLTYENGEQEKFSNSTAETIEPSSQEMNNISITVLEAQIADLESKAHTIDVTGEIITGLAMGGFIIGWAIATDGDGSFGNILLGSSILLGITIGGLLLTDAISKPSWEKANRLRDEADRLRKSQKQTTANLSIQPVMMRDKLNGNLAGGVALSLRF